MQRLTMGLVVVAATLPCLCSQAASRQRPTITPGYVQVTPNQSASFSSAFSGGASAVVWAVDNVVGGSDTSGTVSAEGVYTAPAELPKFGSVTVTAELASDPMVRASATVTVARSVGRGRATFVSPTGSDTAAGTRAAPFRTIGYAASRTAPGDTVYVRGGIYRELVAPTHSGNAAGYITFTAYPGETPILDGTGLRIPGGQAGLVTLLNESYVIVQGFDLRHYMSSKVSAVPIGMFVTGSGSHVQLINNHIHGIVTRAPTTPRACQSNALGLAVYGTGGTTPISDLVISGNELDHLTTGCSESMSLDGNVDGFVVASNLVHDNDNIGIDAIGYEKVSPNPELDRARHGEIRGNTVYNITSYDNPDYGKQYAADGIYVDGGTQITIEQNLVHDVDYGIEMASEHRDHVTSEVIARNNVLYDNNASGITIGGYGAQRGGTHRCMIVNNTLFRDSGKPGGAGEFQIQFNATGNVFENNIVVSGRPGLLVHGYAPATSSPTRLDYNVYDSLAAASDASWTIDRTTSMGFAAYRAATSLDEHSVFADPLFDSTRSPVSLNLQPASPASGAGTDLGASIIGTADFAGHPRTRQGTVDAGAFQH